MKPVNKRAQDVEKPPTPELEGYACSNCCVSYAPGWEVSSGGAPDPCPWMSDLHLCYAAGCYWGNQVPDQNQYPTWFDACSQLQNDWAQLCTVPDV